MFIKTYTVHGGKLKFKKLYLFASNSLSTTPLARHHKYKVPVQ
jgi:hypothetical protein